MIRVIAADDHPVFLDGLCSLIESTPGLTVVGRATNGRELVELASVTEHEVAVVDLDMPELDGAIATRELLRSNPEARILILTMHQDDDSLTQALRAGARGYLLKGAAHGSIARAIEALADGQSVLDENIATRVLTSASASRPSATFSDLTRREAEVLKFVAQGLGNGAIASRLFLSVKTVQNHVSAIMTKIGASSRAELVALARDAEAP